MTILHKIISVFALLTVTGPFAFADTAFYGDSQNPLPPIIFVGDKDYPPIEWLEEGEPRGIFPSFLNEYADAIDRKIEYKLMDWKQAQQEVLLGRADVLTVFSPNDERIEHYDFIDGFLNFEISLFLRSDNLTIHGLKDLKGVKTGVTKGGFPRKIIATQSQARLITINDHLSGFQKLLNGDIDALATTKWVGSYIIQKHHLEGIKFAEKPIATKPTHMGIKKGNQELQALLSQGIQVMQLEGTIEQLNKQWSGFNIIYLTEAKLQKLSYLFAIVLFVLLLSIAVFVIFSLKKQVRDRTQSLEASNANLQASLIALEQTQSKLIESKKTEALISIVANVAHKINTPLGIIITLSSTLETNSETIKEKLESNTLSQRALAEYIEDAASSLKLCTSSAKETSHLLDNFQKLTTNQSLESRDHFNLFQTIEDSVTITQPSLIQKKISIEVLGSKTTYMDSYQSPLAQALIILINNALKHAYAEQLSGTVKIQFNESKNLISLCISDDGCGIPKAHLNHLFDPFYTIDHSLSGSGLGLSIVYSIVTQILGGDIKVASVQGEGTTFTLRLPISAPEMELK